MSQPPPPGPPGGQPAGRTWPTSGGGFRPPMVVAIDPATEEATTVMTLDDAAVDEEYVLADGCDWREVRPEWHDDTLVILNEAFCESDLDDAVAMLVHH